MKMPILPAPMTMITSTKLPTPTIVLTNKEIEARPRAEYRGFVYMRASFRINFRRSNFTLFGGKRVSTIALRVSPIVQTILQIPMISLAMVSLGMKMEIKHMGFCKRSSREDICPVLRRKQTTRNVPGYISTHQKDFSRASRRYRPRRCFDICLRGQMKSFPNVMETCLATLECLRCRKSYKPPLPRTRNHS